jgi:hypothetical protein
MLPSANASRVKWDVFSSDVNAATLPLLQQRVFDVVRLTWGIPRLDTTRLPAPQPATFSRLSDIVGATHVGVKSDGVRAMLIVLDDGVAVLVDRAFKMSVVKDVSPALMTRAAVFDGELVADGAVISGQPAFVVFDAFRVGDADLTGGVGLDRRMELVRGALLPGTCLTLTSPRGALHVNVSIKEWLRLGDVTTRAKLAQWVATTPTDGLVFWKDLGAFTRLRAGTQPGLFKWKARHTIDFLWDAHQQRLILVDFTGGDGDTPSSSLFVSASRAVGVVICPSWRERLASLGRRALHNTVLECTVERAVTGDVSGWRATPVLIRDDKQRPNNVVVAERTLDVIMQMRDLSIDRIFAFIDEFEDERDVTR